MTRKDYKVIAEALRECRPDKATDSAKRIGWEWAVDAVASACARDNPRFSYAKFREAVYRES